MLLADILVGVKVLELHSDAGMEITGVSYDSRTTKPGELFVAVRGYESDGHHYVGAAVAKGAACILCESAPDTDIPYVLTDNSRKSLAVVSSNWFENPASKLILVGVTGTNGKTTTTHIIKALIEKCTGAKVGLIGTNNNMIDNEILETEHTTPESLELQSLFRRMVDAGCRYAVMEVSSHALFLDRVAGLCFEVGVFTNLTHEHLDFHNTMEEYAEAKALLFKQSQHGVVNLDDDFAEVMIQAAQCPVFTFSVEKNTADLVAKRIKVYPDKVEFCALTLEKLQKLELAIPAKFSVYNALAAVGACLQLGLSMEALSEAIKTCHGVKGRLEVVPTGRDFTVIIDYAHKPFALENIITALKEYAPGRVVTLFGCGGDRDKAKRPIMGEIAARLSDFVIVTSDNPRTEVPSQIIADIAVGLTNTKTPHKVIENRREAIAWSLAHAEKNDIILLAGKGHETYQIIGKEKFHFDEREIVRECLK